MNWEIKEISIEAIHPLTHQIPEFINPYPLEEYYKRFLDTPHLCLAAFHSNQIMGFKIGYEREEGVFYSWMGAVLPQYRKMQVAKQLAKHQEQWAKNAGYQKIKFKTRNKLRSMLLFAIKNDFNIIGVEPRDEIGEYRIVLEKFL